MSYAKIKNSINVSMICLGVVAAVALVIAAAGGALYAVVRIVRVAWGP